jgi:oxygen-independent coproporphyrinogen-3 oxidase
VITQLMCNFKLSKKEIEEKYGIPFDSYFADSLESLQSFQADGLISLEENEIRVLPAGRLLIRNIAMNFDAYLMSKEGNKPQFSRTV